MGGRISAAFLGGVEKETQEVCLNKKRNPLPKKQYMYALLIKKLSQKMLAVAIPYFSQKDIKGLQIRLETSGSQVSLQSSEPLATKSNSC